MFLVSTSEKLLEMKACLSIPIEELDSVNTDCPDTFFSVIEKPFKV